MGVGQGTKHHQLPLVSGEDSCWTGGIDVTPCTAKVETASLVNYCRKCPDKFPESR